MDILLLEPNYKNKYPPLGLMKIAYYHKKYKKDFVFFSKGELTKYKSKKWDRIYITTLFTFEWEITKKTILYAKHIAKDLDNIFIGGIAASLFPEKIFNETGIRPIIGLLNEKGKIGYEDDYIIDTLTPDYSILEDIRDTYKYPYENAYFLFMTKGCGMNCDFCAVKTLEPEYVPFISIKKQLNIIKRNYGEKKDLLLMDNNVLKSPNFEKIIDEIKECGFYKGSVYKNSKTGKTVNRYVDFNQGLDAQFLTEKKAKKLSEIAIRPARIAFDHINQSDVYISAFKNCIKYDITHLSNYMLYNNEDFKGKGIQYCADLPVDLYNRLKLTLDLKEEYNINVENEKKVKVFSFPMRYIPLNDDKRGYVGANWNPKYLRAIQTMLIPTQGKGVSSKSFFEADFGKNSEEYLEILIMPEHLIALRGRFEEKKVTLKSETINEKRIRKKQWENNQFLIDSWRKDIRKLGTRRDEFLNLIKDNKFNYDKFISITDNDFKEIFLFYFDISKLLTIIYHVEEEKDKKIVYNFCIHKFPMIFERIIQQISTKKVHYYRYIGFLKVFGKEGLIKLLSNWVHNGYNNEHILLTLDKAQKQLRINFINAILLRVFIYYVRNGCLSKKDENKIKIIVKDLDDSLLLDLLKKNFDKFKKSLDGKINDSVGKDELRKQVNIIVENIYKQISIFD